MWWNITEPAVRICWFSVNLLQLHEIISSVYIKCLAFSWCRSSFWEHHIKSQVVSFQFNSFQKMHNGSGGSNSDIIKNHGLTSTPVCVEGLFLVGSQMTRVDFNELGSWDKRTDFLFGSRAEKIEEPIAEVEPHLFKLFRCNNLLLLCLMTPPGQLLWCNIKFVCKVTIPSHQCLNHA